MAEDKGLPVMAAGCEIGAQWGDLSRIVAALGLSRDASIDEIVAAATALRAERDRLREWQAVPWQIVVEHDFDDEELAECLTVSLTKASKIVRERAPVDVLKGGG